MADIMAALEPKRYQLQIVHEFDSCCFRGGGLHPNITAFNKFAQSHVNGWFQTAVTSGNYHEVRCLSVCLFVSRAIRGNTPVPTSVRACVCACVRITGRCNVWMELLQARNELRLWPTSITPTPITLPFFCQARREVAV